MMTIAEAVTAARDGRQDAWDHLVDTYSGLVWSVIRSCDFYADAAADISQTVWLRCVESLSRLREPENMAAWLATITRNECYKVSRMRGRSTPVADIAELPEAPSDPGEMLRGVLRTHDIDRVRTALAVIPERCRTLLLLLANDPPASYDDIVAALDMPKGSIGPTRSRCLSHLRKALDEVSP